MKKYIILFKKPDEFNSTEELLEYDKSYKDENGRAIPLEVALELKRQGRKILYPRSEIRFHFIIVPQYSGGYTVLPGRPLSMSGGGCPIRNISRKSVDVCLWENLNVNNPSKDLLETAAILVRGVLSSEGIEPRRVLPARYFDKKTDSPGLLFNTKRFVKEYIQGDK